MSYKQRSAEKKPNFRERVKTRVMEAIEEHRSQKAPKTEDEKHQILKTSVTLEYQEDRWGVDRICLDGIQNHLPSDSKGTEVHISYLVDGKWTDKDGYHGGKINAIQFSDNGLGYSSGFLELFKSTKKDSRTAVGHFGEGLKMLSAACIREGIDLELRSQDWAARPFAIERNIDGNRAEQLAFRIETGKPKIRGSESIFWNPSDQFVNFVKDLDTKVLPLRKDFKYLYASDEGNIVDTKGYLFARGVYINSSTDLLFSYDFDIIPNRDRDNVSERELKDKIYSLWRSCRDPKTVADFFEALEKDEKHSEKGRQEKDSEPPSKNSYELNNLRRNFKGMDYETWVKGFLTHYGENAVLVTSRSLSGMVSNLGYKPVNVSTPDLAYCLKQMGVRTDFDVIGQGNELMFLGEKFDSAKISKEVVQTSISLDYRAKAWGELRIFLDGVSNHLPEDSGGTSTKIEYLVDSSDNSELEWINPDEKNFGGKKVRAIRISDDGRGYALEKLKFLKSDKSENSVGQFGEGLKMLSAACLREGINIKFSSRDWLAMPIKDNEVIDDKDVGILAFSAVRGVEKRVGSTTTIFSPSDDMVRLFNSKSMYFLQFSTDMFPLHETEHGSILESYDDRYRPQKNVYVKNVFLCGQPGMLFNYNLMTNKISPDRDNIDTNVLKKEIGKLLGSCVDKRVISAFLRKAATQEYFFEKEIDFKIEEGAKEAWVKTFKEIFGENAVLSTEDPSIDYDARHTGYELVNMDSNLKKILKMAGVRNSNDVVFRTYDTDEVLVSALNQSEKENLALTKLIDKLYGVDYSRTIKIYSRHKDGSSEPLPPAFWDGAVHISRQMLLTPLSIIEVYEHEIGHAITGASDPDDRFRAFFEVHLASLVMKELKKTNGPMIFSSIPIDYNYELKRVVAERRKFEAMQATLKKQQELAESERERMDQKYGERINDLETQLRETSRELLFEKQKSWYENTWWYKGIKKRRERKEGKRN
jgi:hypothetical protein